MGRTSTPYLISALRSPNRQVRALAAATLGVSEDPAAPEVLLAEVKRAPFPTDLHNALVRSIIHHRPLTAAVLVEMLSLIDVAGPETHAAVVDAAGFTLDPRFIAPLTRVLADEGRCRSWSWAARSLGFLGGDAAELGVIDVLVSRARELREGWVYSSARLEAIQALGRLRDPAGQEVLIQLAGLAVERPVLAPASASRDEVDRNLHDQTVWNVKVTARSALAHLKDSSAPLNPPAGEMGPIMPPGATPEVPPTSAGGR
jgi:HEAT repeat protein